jgi:hypothetical protein
MVFRWFILNIKGKAIMVPPNSTRPTTVNALFLSIDCIGFLLEEEKYLGCLTTATIERHCLPNKGNRKNDDIFWGDVACQKLTTNQITLLSKNGDHAGDFQKTIQQSCLQKEQ